ncbi:helix-turn-helix domain-containing protein [Parasphingopyxis marina]|uniref:helix-turn-helix domain-containing protein n=1 Tax=Parasphingopyxis marina TaxID=2761622 RepID=UPI001F47BB14|nr:helix-turn-helix domain-containing protein [Parasphingopyxis marina]
MNDLSKYSLEYAAPADDLKELVSSFYWFRADIEETQQTERADRAQFRFLLEGSGGYEFSDGVYMDSAKITVIGPTTGPTIGHVKGPIEIFGAGLQPAGWGTLMGAAGEQYSNRLIDATAIFGNGLLDVFQTIKMAKTMEEKVAIGNEFARALLRRAEPAPFWFTRLVDKWLTSSASPDINDLIEESGLSKRQVERLTKRFYGAPPKLLARKYRALRAASRIVRREEADGEAVEDAFYDQSHLIREIKEFTGITPGQARKAPPELIRAVAEHRRKLAGKVDPLISDA